MHECWLCKCNLEAVWCRLAALADDEAFAAFVAVCPHFARFVEGSIRGGRRSWATVLTEGSVGAARWRHQWVEPLDPYLPRARPMEAHAAPPSMRGRRVDLRPLTALQMACPRPDMVRWVLTLAADSEARSAALCHAVKDLTCVELIQDCEARHLQQALESACAGGHLSVAQRLAARLEALQQPLPYEKCLPSAKHSSVAIAAWLLEKDPSLAKNEVYAMVFWFTALHGSADDLRHFRHCRDKAAPDTFSRVELGTLLSEVSVSRLTAQLEALSPLTAPPLKQKYLLEWLDDPELFETVSRLLDCEPQGDLDQQFVKLALMYGRGRILESRLALSRLRATMTQDCSILNITVGDSIAFLFSMTRLHAQSLAWLIQTRAFTGDAFYRVNLRPPKNVAAILNASAQTDGMDQATQFCVQLLLEAGYHTGAIFAEIAYGYPDLWRGIVDAAATTNKIDMVCSELCWGAGPEAVEALCGVERLTHPVVIDAVLSEACLDWLEYLHRRLPGWAAKAECWVLPLVADGKYELVQWLFDHGCPEPPNFITHISRQPKPCLEFVAKYLPRLDSEQKITIVANLRTEEEHAWARRAMPDTVRALKKA